MDVNVVVLNSTPAAVKSNPARLEG